jgi:hypothetical protein
MYGKIECQRECFSVLNYKHFTERDTFWIDGGGRATYTENCIRRCVSEMLPDMAERNSFCV